MAIRYTVEEVCPEQRKPELMRVWGDNLPLQTGGEEKYRWMYQQAPDRPPSVFLLCAADGSKSEIVGTAGFGIRRFHSRAGALTAGLLGDLAVDRAHRTLMPALTLVRRSKEVLLERYDLSYGFPNPNATVALRRTGYQTLGTMTRHACMLRHAGYLARFTGSAWLGRLVSPLPDLAKLLLLAARSLVRTPYCRLVWRDEVDSSFDALFEAVKDEFGIVGCRTARFLHWRFLENPSDSYQFACLTRRGESGELLAYAVIQPDGPTAHIRDVFGHPADLKRLLDRLLLALWRRGFSSVSLGLYGGPSVVSAIRSRGFVPRASEQSVLMAWGSSQPGSPELDALGHWHLTDADRDV